MIVIICIAAVAALISLYDYFSTRSWQQVTSGTRNTTVFAHRNRSYGAYVMRRDYDKRLLLILAAIAGGAGVFYAATRKPKMETVVIARTTTEDTMVYVLPEKDPELPTDPVTDEPPATSGAELTFTEPVVSQTEPESGPLPVDPVGIVGPVIGEPGFPPIGDPEPPVGGGGITEPIDPPTGPYEYLPEPAEFPGGREALLTYLGNKIHYPEAEAQLGIEGKCFLKFVVSKVGDISHVQVMRGVTDCKACDEEAVRVVKNMPHWRPGKLNGKPVDSYFNLPINFKLKKD